MSKDSKDQPIQRVPSRTESPDLSSLQSEIEKVIAQDLKLAKDIEQSKKEHKKIDPEVLIQLSRNLPRLIQKTLQKVEASQVYQTFKLPGSDHVVHDRRPSAAETKPEKKETDKAKMIADEAKMPLESFLAKRGKIVSGKEKDYENFFADPAQKVKLPEQKTAEERLKRLFSRFESALLRRFEWGEQMVRRVREGEASFFKKTADQWRAFFGRFAKRAVKRHVALENVDGWTFRGLVRKDSKATVVSDLALANGQIEKFVRFRLPRTAGLLAERLSVLEPGTRLGGGELKEQGKDLEYLAIKEGSPEASFTTAPTKGKFLGTAQAEEKVAGDLGLQLGAQLKEKTRHLKKLSREKSGGGMGWAGEEEAPPQEENIFVPWWSRPFQKAGGRFRWFVPVTYAVLLALLGLGFWFLVR